MFFLKNPITYVAMQEISEIGRDFVLTSKISMVLWFVKMVTIYECFMTSGLQTGKLSRSGGITKPWLTPLLVLPCNIGDH